MNKIYNIQTATLCNRRFRISGEKIGSGSFGIVYLAYDTVTGLSCVVKFSLHKDILEEEAQTLKLL